MKSKEGCLPPHLTCLRVRKQTRDGDLLRRTWVNQELAWPVRMARIDCGVCTRSEISVHGHRNGVSYWAYCDELTVFVSWGEENSLSEDQLEIAIPDPLHCWFHNGLVMHYIFFPVPIVFHRRLPCLFYLVAFLNYIYVFISHVFFFLWITSELSKFVNSKICSVLISLLQFSLLIILYFFKSNAYYSLEIIFT